MFLCFPIFISIFMVFFLFRGLTQGATYTIVVESSFIVFFSGTEALVEGTITAAATASAVSTTSTHTAAIKRHHV